MAGRVSSANAIRPLNSASSNAKLKNVSPGQRPMTSKSRISQSQQELSKENFDKFLLDKMQTLKQFPQIQDQQEYYYSQMHMQPQEFRNKKSASNQNLPALQNPKFANRTQNLSFQPHNQNKYEQLQQYQQQQWQTQKVRQQYQQQRPFTSKTAVNFRPKSSVSKPLVVHIEQNFDQSQGDLRDTLWDQVYIVKNQINQIKESNNNLRAKIWNFEKENRTLQKQIEQWKLETGAIIDQDNKAFVDSATSEKVYKDFNFSAVSIKQQMKQLKEQIDIKDAQIAEYKAKIEAYSSEADAQNEAMNEQFKEVLQCYFKLQEEAEKYRNPDYDEYDNIEEVQLQIEKHTENIKELMARNNVVKFEIEVQKNAQKKSIKENEMIIQKIEVYDQEIEHLQNELKKYGNHQEYYGDMNQMVKKRPQMPQQKQLEEELDQREKLILEQKKQINDINFQIQEMTRSSILEKQDLKKDIDEMKLQIAELEEKYLILLAKYNRERAFEKEKDKSLLLTMYNSEIKEIDISIIPSYIINEDPDKKTSF